MARRHWTQHLAPGRLPAASAPRAPLPPRSHPARAPRPTSAHWAQLDALVPELQCVDIDLMGKPRMTRRDRWAKRPCVLRYRAQADHLRLAGLRLPMRYVAVVFLRMPDSWSVAERRRQAGQPHLVRPDSDNLTKALLDSLAPSDAHLWDGRLQKRWSWHGRLLLLRAPLDEATLERHLQTFSPKEPGHAR